MIVEFTILRNGKILFQTRDHSEVQSLIDMGEITEADAQNHPRKNVITRAINAKTPSRIDQQIIKDIRENDFFLLCTDGILENLNQLKINNWFVEENDPGQIKSKILKNALINTKDNFSMYLLKIDNLEDKRTKSESRFSFKELLNLFK